MAKEKHSYSQWLPGLKQSLHLIKWHQCFLQVSSELRLQYGTDNHSLWIRYSLGRNKPLWCIRTCFDPQGQLSLHAKPETQRQRSTFKVQGGVGSFHVELEMIQCAQNLIRCKTSFTPKVGTIVEAMPRDLYMLGDRNDPLATDGKVFGKQNANGAAFVLATQLQPQLGTVLYFQQLTSLNDYFQTTQTDAKEVVGGQWPEIGLKLPASKQPLSEGVEVCTSDAFIVAWNAAPPNATIATHWFTDGMAEIYPHLDRPDVTYFDWPALAKRTLRSLASKGCAQAINGKTYLNAYVGSDRKPPESMVHCAILVPLVEFDDWRTTSSALTTQLTESLTKFYDVEIGSIVRWLPGQNFDNDGHSPGEEEHLGLVDSWYLYHVMMNLARLTQLGIRQAEEVFRNSMTYAIKVARHFDYDWPVFFEMNSLRVTKQETAPGDGGEQDVPGLYIKLMMLAHQIQPNQMYVDEAIRAADRLKGLGFNLLYLTNNTVMGSEGLLLLWKATSNREYLDLSLAGIANVISKMWFWKCNYGLATNYETFLAISPLNDCEYTAAYEEAEVLATIQGFLKEIGDHAPASIRLLLSEYFKYFLARGRYYFPTELPADVLSKENKEGRLNSKLSIPIEDIRTGWQLSGQVGQETYGAATPFILCTRAYIRHKTVPFSIYCECPVGFSDYQTNDKNSGVVHFNLGASDSLDYKLSIQPIRGGLPTIQMSKNGELVEHESKTLKPQPSLTYSLKGNSKIKIKWSF